MIEGDKIFIINGIHANRSGRIKIKTSNGWYHIKIKGSPDLIKLRLVDIIPYNQKHNNLNLDGMQKDHIYDRKIKEAYDKLNRRQKDINLVAELIRTRASVKEINSAVRRARYNKISPEVYRLIGLGRMKKRSKKLHKMKSIRE